MLSTPQPRKWSPSIKPSSKWVGHNQAHPSKWTTPLLLASPTTPLSRKKPSQCTSAYGGSAAENSNNSSATTGIRAVTIGQTTTPSTTHQSTTKPTYPSMPVQQPKYLELLPHSGPAAFSCKQTHQHAGFFLSLGTKLRMSLQRFIVYLLLTYSAHTHKACCSDLAFLVTWSPFTLLLGCEWTYVATVHSSSHQAMTRASDQLHTTNFCSPPVSSNTRDTCNTCDTQSRSRLVDV